LIADEFFLSNFCTRIQKDQSIYIITLRIDFRLASANENTIILHKNAELFEDMERYTIRRFMPDIPGVYS
jgi:hypothetical protein